MVFALGCNTDTRIEYQHDPTLRIETDRTLTRPELMPFTVEGVVVAPLFRVLTPQTTQVWLKLWSAATQTVSVRAALLSGAPAAPSQPFAAEHTVTTEKKDNKGGQYGLVLLGELGNEALAALAADGQTRLAVELRVTPMTDYKPLRFDITRHQSKHWATH